jgi:hypothetical protein
MANVVLVVVPEPAEGTATVLRWSGEGLSPIMDSGGDVNMLCGDCGFTIAERMDSASQVSGIVFECPRCHKFNATRT